MDDRKKPKPTSLELIDKSMKQYPDSDDFMAQCTNLWSVLTPRWEGDAMVRQPARITIMAEGGLWRITLHCPTEGVQAVLHCPKLGDIWDTVERALRTDTIVWTSDYKRRTKKESPTVVE